MKVLNVNKYWTSCIFLIRYISQGKQFFQISFVELRQRVFPLCNEQYFSTMLLALLLIYCKIEEQRTLFKYIC